MIQFLMKLADYGLPGIRPDKAIKIFEDILVNVPLATRKRYEPEDLAVDLLPKWVETHRIFVISEHFTIENGHEDEAYEHCLLQALFDAAHVKYYLAKSDDLTRETEFLKRMDETPHILYTWGVKGDMEYGVPLVDISQLLSYSGIDTDKYEYLVAPLIRPQMFNGNPGYIFYGPQEEVQKRVAVEGKAYRNIWYKEISL